MSTVTQRQSIAFTGTLSQLHYYLSQLSGDIEKVEQADKVGLKVFKAVTLLIEPRMVTLEVRVTIEPRMVTLEVRVTIEPRMVTLEVRLP